MSICKHCKSDDIGHFEEQETITYKDNDLKFSIEYSICNNCHREFLSKQQILNNDARFKDAKKSVDGLLTSTEVYSARTKLGLTQEQAALVFGGGKNAFSKYERAEVSQSAAMDKLIRTCLHHPNVFKELLTEAGISRPITHVIYEDNVIPYSKHKAASQEKYTSKKEIALREQAYG